MGNTQTVHFQANQDFKIYRWFSLRKSDVRVLQLENQIMERFKLDELPDDKTFSVCFLPRDGDWTPLDQEDDIESLFRLSHGKGTKRNPISLQVKIIKK